MTAKIGRNEACPCGSGKKYKRCCLEDVEQAARTGVAVEFHHDDIDALSNHANDLIKARKFAHAETVCRKLLADFPEQIDGWDRLAQLRDAQGHREEAAKLYRVAAAFAESHEGFDPEGIAWYREQAQRLERSR